jgi:hypothetical protein
MPLGVGSSGEVVDVSPSWNIRPVSLEDPGAVFVILDLTDALEAEGFDGEIQTAHSAEQTQVLHPSPCAAIGRSCTGISPPA